MMQPNRNASEDMNTTPVCPALFVLSPDASQTPGPAREWETRR